MIDGSSILVTGGTGSFGKKFIRTVLNDYDVNKVIVYSRDELKQFEMMNDPTFKPHLKKLRFFIGDVRDKERLLMALDEIDFVIHAAAIKQVPAAEYNPMECIKTNILGAQNIIEACLRSKVQRVVALSTDKAASPVNLYGATKLCSDKLFVAANNMVGNRDLRFSVVRYGNVLGSRGSVIPFFLERKDSGELPITDANMTRFSISLEEGVKFVLPALKNAWGGELFVPKIPSYRIVDVAKAVAPKATFLMTGIRPGEKIHEEMITETDSFNTLDLEDFYVIYPTVNSRNLNVDKFIDFYQAKRVPPGFKYNSGDNEHFLTVSEIREQIKIHLNQLHEG